MNAKSIGKTRTRAIHTRCTENMAKVASTNGDRSRATKCSGFATSQSLRLAAQGGSEEPYGQLNTFGFRSSTPITEAEPTAPLAPIPEALETILPVVLPQTLYECVVGHCTSEGLGHCEKRKRC